MKIRAARREELVRLYEICLLTADVGDDASAIFSDSKALGDIWVGPYVLLEPDHAFVLAGENDEDIGYCIAARDTKTFQEKCDLIWWPGRQGEFEHPVESHRASWSRDEKLAYEIHHPTPSPTELLDLYPSQAHINLLPAARGLGLGRKIMEAMEDSLRAKGSHGLHLRVNPVNYNALDFYQALGYAIVMKIEHETIVAKAL